MLDFIGQANRKYNFEDKFAALLSNATRSVSREIKDGFVSVPKGCYIQLEKKAAKYILENIRASYGNTAGLVARAASFTEDSGLELTLKNFLDHYHLDPRAIYKFSSFSRICARADAIEDFSEPLEDILTKAFAKLAVADSRRWISFLLDVLPRLDNLDFAALPDAEKRMMQMFYVTVWGNVVEDWDDEEVLLVTSMPCLTARFCSVSSWSCCVIASSRSTSLTSRLIWALTVLWICIAPIPATSSWWRWTL